MNAHGFYRAASAFVFGAALLLLLPAGASAVGSGKTCGGVANIACDAGLFCQTPMKRCAVADGAGKCARIPKSCFNIRWQVCGCDGKTYKNDCERQQAKVSLDH
jgi:hypothetical protein